MVTYQFKLACYPLVSWHAVILALLHSHLQSKCHWAVSSGSLDSLEGQRVLSSVLFSVFPLGTLWSTLPFLFFFFFIICPMESVGTFSCSLPSQRKPNKKLGGLFLKVKNRPGMQEGPYQPSLTGKLTGTWSALSFSSQVPRKLCPQAVSGLRKPNPFPQAHLQLYATHRHRGTKAAVYPTHASRL